RNPVVQGQIPGGRSAPSALYSPFIPYLKRKVKSAATAREVAKTIYEEVVYCLYFGLTDKDTGKQELTMDEAKDIAIPLFIEAGSGYTVYEAEGGFAKEDGTVVQNDTLVFDSTHGDEQAILDLIEKVRRALNVESVYCESKLVGCQIRGGVISGVS
ncbi:hypothetical protein, partial [Hominenteromicrobium sp.]